MIDFLKLALWIFALIVLVCVGFLIIYWACNCGSWLGLLAFPALALIIATIIKIDDYVFWHWL